MLLRTHLMFAILMIILFVQYVNNKVVFVVMVLIATMLPDADTGFSTIGKNLLTKPLQFFVKHRGVVHSFTLAVILSLLIAMFFPVASFGFFMGYSVHLVCDSFTKDGIQPFWPFKARSQGFIRSGGKIEETLFLSLILIDVIVFAIVLLF